MHGPGSIVLHREIRHEAVLKRFICYTDAIFSQLAFRDLDGIQVELTRRTPRLEAAAG